MPIRISFIYYSRALPSSISFPMDILYGAAAAHRATYRQSLQVSIETIGYLHSGSAEPVYHLHQIDKPFADVQTTQYDLIILPAIWRNPQSLLKNCQPLLRWLSKQYQQGANICAVGTASSLLAEAGLLDGKPATTHWFYFDEFEKRYPNIKLQRNHLITQADRLYCAGSINAVADLSIYFSEQFFGRQIAQQIESHFSPEIRRPVEQQWYKEQQLQNMSDERVSLIKHWILEHYMQPLKLASLAAQVQISGRHLNRIFQQETGLTPLQFLHKHRIMVAKDLLQNSNLSVAEISEHIGYTESSYFIHCFKRELQVTPKQYRQRLRNKLFN